MPGPSIALVDDDVSVRRSLSRLLSSRGFVVTTYASGEEFLARRADDAAPDCMVLDIHLPGMSGLELRRRLRAEGVDIPIVFITALDDDALIADARHGGSIVPCLRKPFEQTALIECIAHAMDRERPA